MQRQLAQNQEMRRWLRPVERLIEGNEQGHYALPENLTGAMAHLRTVQDAVGGMALPPNPEEAAAKLAGTVRQGSIPEDLGKKLLRSETRHEEALAQLQVLRLAETQAAIELRDLFDANAEDIVTEYLRSALSEVLAEAAKLAPKARGCHHSRGDLPATGPHPCPGGVVRARGARGQVRRHSSPLTTPCSGRCSRASSRSRGSISRGCCSSATSMLYREPATGCEWSPRASPPNSWCG